MKKLNAKGFTLIEMMIVVSIIGILTAIAIPRFQAMNWAWKHQEEPNPFASHLNTSYRYHVSWPSGSGHDYVDCNKIDHTPCGLTLTETSDNHVYECVVSADITSN